jgi:subtilisin family serine protease
MKKASSFFFTIGILFIGGFLGYRILNHKGVTCVEQPEEIFSPARVTPPPSTPSAVSTSLQQVDIAAAPRFAVAKSPDQPQPAVQVVSTPDSRFQPIAEAQIVEQRVTVVSEDQKKRELLVKAEGKYPYRRVEETLMKNGADDTYMIAARTEMVASHVLVKLQEGKTEDDLRAMLEGHGVSILRPLTLPGHYIISLKAPTLDAVPEALSVFSAESNVLAYTEPDFYSSMLTVPNDSNWSNLWGMVKINATGAWDVATGSTNIVVAVIDTGIDLTHPDLVSNLWINAAEANGTPGVDDDGNGFIDDTNGWDFASEDRMPSDDVGHGTHCAGTIGAVGNNGLGVAGVCWKVRLMALKALGTGGGTASDIAEAVHYATDKGARVISASYGGSSYSDTGRDAIIYANSKSVLFVAAAGNDGANNDLNSVYPSGYDIPNIISVAATDQGDALASFSNYGKTSVDLAAPGVSIYSTVPGGTNASFEFLLGTSMATPHVAGAAALLLSYKPSLTHLQLKQALLKTVDPVPSLTNKMVSGGRLNVYKLLTLLDTDNDGMPDNWESANGLNPLVDDSALNPDSDGLTNLEEYSNGTSPQVADTDGDTLPDGWEIEYGFDPNSPAGGFAISSRRGIYLGDGAKNIAVAGNYAYVAAGSAGLGILNIADPQNPVLAGSCGTGGTANDVAISGNYVYVADGANGLAIIDATTPASPWRVGWTNTPGTAEGVAVQSNYVYLADGANELMIFSVTNPASPRLIKDTFGTQRTMHDIFVQGTYVYLAMNEEVRRFNVANPATVSTADKIAPPFTAWNMTGVHGSGSNIVAVAGVNGVKVMSTNLTILGSYNTDGTASGVFVSGNYAHIADGTNGLVVLNIKTPSAPTQIVHVATAGAAVGVCVSGDKVYVATSAGVEIFSILLDSDGDGLSDSWEIQYFGNLSRNGTLDWDGDGISDRGEYLAGTNPKNTDSDGDGLSDGAEVVTRGTDPTSSDTDGDGLSDGAEVLTHGTNPLLADTDGDGFMDGFEVANGFNPLILENPAVTDHDSDGLTDAQEVALGTDPANDSDPLWVDDDAAGDVAVGGEGDTENSDPLADGSIAHPFDAIQKAIDSTRATNGITILVTNGVYFGPDNYAIDTKGKSLKIRSLNGPASTIINSLDLGPVFDLSTGEGTNTTIRGFSMTSSGGGYSVVVLDGVSVQLNNCWIYDSLASGIECLNAASPSVSSCTVHNVKNGIYATSAGLTVQNSAVSNCTGRGIVIVNDDFAEVTWSTIENCAGGITLDNSDAAIRQCIVRNNTDTNGTGAGLLLTGNSSPLIQNSLIVGNRAGTGGGLYISSGCNPTGVNCTVANNYAGISGGGLATAGKPVLRNMIIWGNTAVVSNKSIHKITTNSPAITYSCVEGGFPTLITGAVTNNPLFVGGGDYHLASTNSPCYNKGTLTLSPTIDLDGNPRPTTLPSTVDMGCYEGASAPIVLDTDSDGLLDSWEMEHFGDLLQTGGGDWDSDGLTNLQEYMQETDPKDNDTDNDGMPDGWEVANGFDPLVNDSARDTDSDGLSDYYEMTTNAAITNLYITLPNNPDTDGDGMPDGWENRYAWPTDALSPVSTNGNHGADGDPDTDGLSNLLEYQWGTNPRLSDTDGDGINDGAEVANGTDPANRYDPVYVDDSAPGDPETGNPNISNTNENGSVTYPFDSIQKAVSSTNTVSGMTVLVADGLYEGTGNYSINPGGKNLKIRSVNGSAATLIKTHAYGPAFIINSGETTNTIIQGFTIETQGDRAPEEGIVVDGASPVIKNCVIHNCGCVAISCLNGAAPKIISCWLYDAKSGLYADGSAGVLLQESVVSNTRERGIVIVNDDLAKVTWSTIENCAGGITLDNSDASIRQCTIRDNDALNYYTSNGVAVRQAAQFDLTTNYVDTTSSDENGAGILILNGSSPLLQNCLIVGNQTWADDPTYTGLVGTKRDPEFGLGAGIYIDISCNPTGVNCTVVDNHANTRGGGLSSAGRPLFRNMIFWDNTSSNAVVSTTNRTTASGVYPNLHMITNVINIWFSDIEYGYPNAVLCITGNPQFVGGGDYSLQGTSPCIDAGTYYLAPLVDIAGNLRPTFTDYPVRVDMGCYEFGASASTNPISLGSQIALESSEADPLADTDGDGVSNGDEMVAGTDSLNENDYFRVYHQQSQADGSVLVAWSSIQGSLYTVQSTDSLTGAWTDESGYVNIAGTGGVMTFSGSLPFGSRFYRVLVRQL